MKNFLMILAILTAMTACATTSAQVEPFDPCKDIPKGWSCTQAEEEDGPVEYVLEAGANPSENPLTLDIPWDRADALKKRMTFGRYVDDGAGGQRKEIVDAEIDFLAFAPSKEKGMSTGTKIAIGTGIGAVVVGTVWAIVYACSDTTIIDASGNKIN